MTIPEIRAALLALADKMVPDLGFAASDYAEEVRTLAKATIRRSPARRAPNLFPRLTEKEKVEIQNYAYNNPGESYVEIARKFNTGPGRVSEAVAGYRQ